MTVESYGSFKCARQRCESLQLYYHVDSVEFSLMRDKRA